MKLIELSANKDSFKTVKFNENGISLIVAEQDNPEEHDTSKTYNGVGKSLIVLLVNFCLGAKKKHYKSFIEKLPDWIFYLTIDINGSKYIIKRSMKEASKIYINDGPPRTIDSFNEEFKNKIFSIPENTPFLSFRNLLPFFIRPLKKNYVFADEPTHLHTPYHKLMANGFLLGLDVNLIEKKHKLRKEQERIEELESNIKSDELLKEFFIQDKDVSLKIKDIEDEITKLRFDRDKYEIAEDYYEVKVEADSIEKELAEKHNEIVLLQNQINNISQSLESSPDLGKDSIERIYNESKIVFPDNVSKTLTDLELFYEELTRNRIHKLSQHKQLISKKIDEYIEEEVKLKQELDKKFKYLGAHQALDVVIKVTDRLNDLEKEKEKLENYENLIASYHEKSLEIKKDFIKYAQQTDEYLKDMFSILEEKKIYFRNLAKRFYPKSSSGITIYNNDGENQIQFDIEAKIESDGSDGINNVKIFCYDMTILFKGHGHNIKFSFHDSRLFDGIDERQKTELFKITNDLFRDSNYQYIATVNQNQLNEIKSILSPEEFENIISKHKVLTLKDTSDSEKLLGIKVDIRYE